MSAVLKQKNRSRTIVRLFMGQSLNDKESAAEVVPVIPDRLEWFSNLTNQKKAIIKLFEKSWLQSFQYTADPVCLRPGTYGQPLRHR